MKQEQALSIADGIVEALTPHCDIINVAGSCRRGKPEVKDIEIVCLPKRKIITDLFGGKRSGGRTKGFVGEVNLLGEPLKGSPVDGRYMQIVLKQGIKLDLFMPESYDYFRQFAIRTGSSDYSMKVLAGGWRKKGWCGSDQGLRKVSDCVSKGPSKWKCVNEEAELPPAWKSEKEFFDWINVRWIDPPLRNV